MNCTKIQSLFFFHLDKKSTNINKYIYVHKIFYPYIFIIKNLELKIFSKYMYIVGVSMTAKYFMYRMFTNTKNAIVIFWEYIGKK